MINKLHINVCLCGLAGKNIAVRAHNIKTTCRKKRVLLEAKKTAQDTPFPLYSISSTYPTFRRTLTLYNSSTNSKRRRILIFEKCWFKNYVLCQLRLRIAGDYSCTIFRFPKCTQNSKQNDYLPLASLFLGATETIIVSVNNTSMIP